ncbi:MAG: hypothetical protein PHF12_00010 [Candidatus Omnitrophica bacterium]|jgi:hypothetical protein|nr:hypothetical protein [Candidatus Omnitrophota bacterium]
MKKVALLLLFALTLVSGCTPAPTQTTTPAPVTTLPPGTTEPSHSSPLVSTTPPVFSPTPALSIPASPKNLKGKLEDPYLREYKSVLLSWDEVSGASGYRVYVSDTENGKYRPLQETKTASCKITERLPRPAYFVVTAMNTVGVSNHSAAVRVDTGLIREGIVSGPMGERNDRFGDEVFRSLAISPSDPNIIYVGSEGNGNFKSTDGGTTWTWQRKGLLYMAGEIIQPPEYAETYDIAIDPVNSLKAYSVFAVTPGPAEGDYPSSNGGFYYTSDGGNTWHRSVKGLSCGSGGAIAIDPANPEVLFLGISGGICGSTGQDISGKLFDGGIYKSTDAGLSWTMLNLPDPQVAAWSDFWKIVAWDSMNIYTLGQKDEDPVPDKALGLVKSSDGGKTWQKISPPGVFFSSFDVAPNDKNIIYGVSYYTMYQEGTNIPSTVFCSKDGGTTWQSVKDYKMYGPVRVSPHDSNVVFISHRDALYKSTDGLMTVKKVLGSDYFITDIEFSLSDPNIIYAGADGLRIFKSTDGGDSFTLKADLRKFITEQK